MKLETLRMQSDSSRSAKEADRHSKTATVGRRKKRKVEKLVELDKERDKELYELKEDIEKLKLRKQKDRRRRRMHEFPMEKAKANWLVKKLMVMRQCRLLKGWLRYAENLKATEEKVIYVCELETGRSLDDFENELGSAEDLKHCQEGREEILACQEGNELRSLRDLMDCQEDSQGISHCQLGNDMRSLQDIEDF
jgi:hypothetical protein